LTSEDYTFHVYGRTEGVAGVIISDHDYPALVAHQLLSKVVDEFLSKYPRSAFANSNPTLAFPELKDYIVKYQDPQQADSIMKIQKELDETKIVLHKTIESVLQRGEKIDDLVAKSDGLSAQSKMFYSELHAIRIVSDSDTDRPISASQEAELVLYTDVDMS
jgi:synaptobrevin homolog YKT6